MHDKISKQKKKSESFMSNVFIAFGCMTREKKWKLW